MTETTYDGKVYWVSDAGSRLVYLVSDAGHKRTWKRVYNRELAYAVRRQVDAQAVAQMVSELDEDADNAYWAQMGAL